MLQTRAPEGLDVIRLNSDASDTRGTFKHMFLPEITKTYPIK
ncbi:hypothetical protein Bhyg_07195 [Pseudolycoriella hygida]|uniref:Uncharacterized protein n=1 Tax=Pseudolycoriella hygida TaxID=35572 RepID=A0A9Q0N253_9DIPT|nr:hypothetical protein Bhyg_07195 [Pseudolycoriella hygida]